MPSLNLGDDGGMVEIRVGETLSLSLPENATTGYRWMADEIDPQVLAVLPDEPTYRDAALGSGGEVTFRAKAVAAGETDLALVKRRPWEGEASAIQRFRVHVTVRSED